MDASSSAGGNGFDAALKALEDLETSVVQTREEKPVIAVAAVAAPAIEPVSAIGFSDGDDNAPPAVIAPALAVDVIELPTEAAAPVAAAEAATHPLPAPAVPAEAVPATPVQAAAAPSAGRFTRIAIGLGLLSSAVSAAGLVVAERVIMSAQLVVADARERARQAEQANKLIRDLQLVRDKQIELLRLQQAQAAATPVSSEELQHRMDALQTGLLARDPMNNVVSAIRESQSGTNARFNEFGMKIDRLEAAVSGRH
ncbi:hypothetical protein ASE00_08300 [Sphingomonas sp. Root710]|uniref:hypothetical protein n=1 Tax=Sphingomonas sp. Root710 TaxID=1736594 RepID=UPI0006F908B7|nr:hypothetical protein [Sphingomonas sp. Root710]KRB86673.1 hypothetical protein ASE00_08300 [Sphingomonas sp. Root710]